MTDRSEFALVTGASSGIGRELSLIFARNGFDLLLCAEDGGLESVAEQCRQEGASVATLQRDLRDAAAVDELHTVLTATGRPVTAAAVNAGVGRGGAFVDTPLADLLEVVELNVVSTLRLTYQLLNDMVARNSGRLLITSSIASTMPGSFQAVYNASKSFVQSLAEALQDELKDTEVTITSLMPGPTETNFFHRAQMDDTQMGQAKKDDPAKVAQQGFDALMSGEKKVVAASVKTKLQEATATVLPDAAKAKMHRQMAEPRGEDS
jgi:short-subunit dehydrogenase